MKIHAGKFVQHPKKGYLVLVARCGKKEVATLDPLGIANPHSLSNGILIGKVTCKTCLNLLKKIKCESPL